MANESGNNNHDWLIHACEKLEPTNYITEFIQHNVRPDGRTFCACRSVSILHSILVRNSVGSALVTFHGSGSTVDEMSGVAGRVAAGTTTRVIAACTLLVGRPSPTTPTQGDIDITVTASPISGPTFDIAGRDKNRYYDVSYIGGGGGGSSNNNNNHISLVGETVANISTIKSHNNTNGGGGSGTDIKEIESYVRRTLRSSNYIDPNELGIVLGTSAFRIRISLNIIDHGGNIRDCVLLAACAALADLRLPTVVVNEDGIVSIVKTDDETNDDDDDDEMTAEIDKSNGQTSRRKKRRKGGKYLSLGPVPVPLTVAIFPPSLRTNPQQQSILLADPTRLEENISGGNIVSAVCNTNDEIVSYHKGGGGSDGYVTMEQMAAIAIMGFGRAKELEELVLGRR